MSSYEDFLSRKSLADVPTGIARELQLSEKLFDWQRDIVRWALRRGRAALFEDCGLGKTAQQLEWAKHVSYDGHDGGHVLVLTPLAVAQQTVQEAKKFAVRAHYVESESEIGGDMGIWVTNYEKLHKFDPEIFRGVVLDESSILKAYDSKTRNTVIDSFRGTPFRLACTATPAPNDHMELGNHAEFVGAMTRTEMLSMFFVHDGGETQKWRLKGHARSAFWKWVCSWAVNLRKPSDIGYPDDRFVLPDMQIHHHVVGGDQTTAAERGLLFNLEARTLSERRAARKASLSSRVAKVAELVLASEESWLVWCDRNDEQNELERLIGDAAVSIRGATKDAERLSFHSRWLSGEVRCLISKPSIFGYGMNWQHCPNVAFCGLSDSWEEYYQAVRRVWRFGQTKPVHCHIVTSEAEGAVVQNIRRKEADAAVMAAEMVGNMSLGSAVAIRGGTRTVSTYDRRVDLTLPSWLKGVA